MIMKRRGWRTTGKKGSLGVRGGRDTETPYHNIGGLALWFIRAERYQCEAGMPYRSVRQRCEEIVERETGDGAIGLARREFPQWEDEIARGIERGTTFAARDAAGETIAFGAHSVNRHTWIGPMATNPARRRGGTGHAVLAALAADVGERFGVDDAEISWVAPVPFYAKAGAVAHRAFRVHCLRLAPSETTRDLQPAPRTR
jgi:hypothetical protein